MIPVTQTILADPSRNDGHDADGRPGNCYQAAIASALELSLEEVPHFAAIDEDWCEKSSEWFLDRGIVRYFYTDELLAGLAYPLYVVPGTDFGDFRVDKVVAALGAGPSPRGAFRHVVVLDPDTGTMSHDPHPSGAGLPVIDEVEIMFSVYGGSI